MAGCLFPEYSVYFGQAIEVWKRHVIGVTIEAFDEYRDSVCKTLQDVAQESSGPVPDGHAVNRQEEMLGTVQSVLENAQHLAQQRIADTLAQTFNSPPPPIILSPLYNQTIQANPPGESAISQGDVNSCQNDEDSLDVSIKNEVETSSESECESDTDDEEVQVKEEPIEEENIIPGLDENYNDTDEASFHEQTENTDNSGDHRENSNEGASEQQESNEAMAIDEELAAEEANSEQDGPIIIEVQYTSPPSSPLNAEANDSFAGQQEVSIALNEDIAGDDEADHLNAEEDGDGDFGEDEHMIDNNYQHNLENQESDLDGEDESDREGEIIDGETDGEDGDSCEDQEDMSGVEDNEQEDSSDETNNDDDDYNETEEEEASLGLAGPSTSAQGRQGTRRVAKRQMVSSKASKRQRTGRDLVTVPLRIITKNLKCTVPGCKKVVKSKRSMNRHLLLKHQLKEFRCLVRRCHGKVSTSFTTQSQLTDHLDQVHGRTTKLTCKCTKKFNSYKKLSLHYWSNHELGHFTCSKEGCPVKSTTTRAKVSNHQYKHREANYECTVDGCGLSFKKKGHFDRHLFTHSVERPFACSECDKSFKRKDSLTTHLLTHSLERPFPCPECDKSFALKSHLTRHLRIHLNDKCFRCTWPQCTLSSTDGSSVIHHIRTAHFNLPRSKKAQLAAGIVDDRDARDFLAKN